MVPTQVEKRQSFWYHTGRGTSWLHWVPHPWEKKTGRLKRQYREVTCRLKIQ